MFKSKTDKGFFEAFSSKTSFIMGLIAGVLIICVVGFFILLADNFDGEKDGNIAQGNKNVNSQPAQPDNQANNQGASNLQKITKDDHIRGDLNAPVMMVEFSDFRCGHCGTVFDTLNQLVDDYQGQVAWVFKHFPVLGDLSVEAAIASECAAEQGKFWEYTDELIANQQLITEEYISQAALKIGLDADKFNDCLSSEKYTSKVAEDAQEAQSVGITGTPGIYVNDQLVKGAYPYETFKQIIDSILAK